MNIEAERFKLIGAHGTREAAKLMDELDAKVRDTLVSQVKHVIHSEEMVREAIRKRHPELTDAEAEVALLIVKDKTVSEICEIRHVSPSTVTSIRSRLRKKAGLRPERKPEKSPEIGGKRLYHCRMTETPYRRKQPLPFHTVRVTPYSRSMSASKPAVSDESTNRAKCPVK